jgi:GntR family phosphonate transport system transcriptional regulator
LRAKGLHWTALKDRIGADISDGRLQPGDRLPAEAQLCALHDTGRHSVRRAIAALAAEGLLRVEQGRGTFVERAIRIDYRISKRTRFRRNLAAQGVAPSGEALGEEICPAPGSVAGALRLAPGDPVWRLLRRGRADGVPINLGVHWYPAARFPELGPRRRAGEAVTEIYRAAGIADYTRQSTVLAARMADRDEARLLGMTEGRPVLVMTKTDVDMDGVPIGWSESVWAADRVRFTLDTGDGEV